MRKLLPIGSVVRLRDSSNLLLIIGYGPISPNGKTHYDYLATNYPFGLGSNMQAAMIDREEIAEVMYSGYVDEESSAYTELMDILIRKDKL